MIEYSKNYKKTIGSLWNYYRDEPNNPNDDYNADTITTSALFKYKSSIKGKKLNANINDDDNNVSIKDNVEIVVPLKYLTYINYVLHYFKVLKDYLFLLMMLQIIMQQV